MVKKKKWLNVMQSIFSFVMTVKRLRFKEVFQCRDMNFKYFLKRRKKKNNQYFYDTFF